LLLIDDGAGRTLAGEFGVRVIGTAGLLLRARKLGYLKSLADELNAFQHPDLYLRPALVAQLLAAAGESPAAQGGT
jgi:predicted nucleic acid-binding protein